VTDARGRYHFIALPVVGEYSVKIELTGFGAEERPGLVFQANTKPVIDFTLKLAALAERRRSWVRRDSRDAQGGAQPHLDQKKIETMPLNGRNYLDLAKLRERRARRGDARRLVGERPAWPEHRLRGRWCVEQGDRVGRRLEDRPVARRRSGIPGDHQPVLRGVRTLARRDRVGGHQERHERVPRHRLHLRSARRARRENGLTGTRTPFNQQQFAPSCPARSSRTARTSSAPSRARIRIHSSWSPPCSSRRRFPPR